MEFLRLILAKIELICQQPSIPQLRRVHPSSGVLEKMAGGSRVGLAIGAADASKRHTVDNDMAGVLELFAINSKHTNGMNRM